MEIVNFFSPLPLTVNDVHFVLDCNGNSKGSAYIDFHSVEDCQMSITRDYYIKPLVGAAVRVYQRPRHCLTILKNILSQYEYRRKMFFSKPTIALLKGVPEGYSLKQIRAIFNGYNIHNDHIKVVGFSKILVEFSTPEILEKVIKDLDGIKIEQHIISLSPIKQCLDIVFPLPGDQNIFSFKRAEKTVILDSLPFFTLEDDIRQFFHGLNISRRGIKFRYIGHRVSCFAYVSFETMEDFYSALSKNGELIKTRSVGISPYIMEKTTYHHHLEVVEKLKNESPNNETPQQPDITNDSKESNTIIM
eukprot:gene4978-6199_t